MPGFGPKEFAAKVDVSRETLDRLTIYADLLVRWQAKVNLVAPATLPDLWQRHMLDSAQLFPLLPEKCGSLADLGAGAGFPGLVLSAMGVPVVHLVESDVRKGVFMREAAREMGLTGVTVHTSRIEALKPLPVDVVMARALASLTKLLDYAAPWMALGAVGLFPKGEGWASELTEAERHRKMKSDAIPSQTHAASAILRIVELQDL